MTFEVRDRIFETSTTVGVGTYTLDGAQAGFQSFSAIGANNECTYFATDDTFWEVGIGKHLTAPSRLTRETILASSNAGAAVNWGGTTVKLRCHMPAAGIAAKRRLSKSVAGGVDVALTQDEQRREIIELTGALTADIAVTVDATVWAWTVFNNTTGSFKLTVKVAGQTGVQIEQGSQAIVYCDGVDVRRAVPHSVPFGFKNRLMNPDGRIYQRAVAATADDNYFADRWYILSQTSTVTPSVLNDPEDGFPKGVRITQSQAAAQRFGFAQIIEGRNCKDLRGRFGVLVPRVRISNSQPIRYAILGWTGTEDAVTSDVVNDWTSADYGEGAAKFFVDANIAILAVGAQTPAANTWTSLAALSAALGSAFNNLIVFVWTEGTAAQNVTLDFDYVQCERGSVATEFERRPGELALCQRYYEKSYNQADAPGSAVSAGAVQFAVATNTNDFHRGDTKCSATKRASATITVYSPASGASGQVRDATAAADRGAVGSGSEGSVYVSSSGGTFTSGNLHYFQWVAEAEL